MAAWNELDHPRDWRGRFITKGTHVTLAGGLVGTVRGVRPGRLEGDPSLAVVQLSDGRESIVPTDRLTVAEPPRGAAYIGDGTAVYVGDIVAHTDSDKESRVKSINEDGSITVGQAYGESEDVDPSTLVLPNASERDTMLPPEGDGALSEDLTPEEEELIGQANRASEVANQTNDPLKHLEAADVAQVALDYMVQSGRDPNDPEVRAVRQLENIHRDEYYNGDGYEDPEDPEGLTPAEDEKVATGKDGVPIRIGDWVEGDDGTSGPVTDIIPSGEDTIVIYEGDGGLMGEDQSFLRNIPKPDGIGIDDDEPAVVSEPPMSDNTARIVSGLDNVNQLADENDDFIEMARDANTRIADLLVSERFPENGPTVTRLRAKADKYARRLGQDSAEAQIPLTDRQQRLVDTANAAATIADAPTADRSDRELARDFLNRAADSLTNEGLPETDSRVLTLRSRAERYQSQIDSGIRDGQRESNLEDGEDAIGADNQPIRIGDIVGYDSENPEGVVVDIRDGMIIFRDNDDDEEVVGYPTDMYSLGSTRGQDGRPTPTGDAFADAIAISDWATQTKTNPRLHQEAIGLLNDLNSDDPDVEARLEAHDQEWDRINAGEYGALDADGQLIGLNDAVREDGGDYLGRVVMVGDNFVTVVDEEGEEVDYQTEILQKISEDDASVGGSKYMSPPLDPAEFSIWGNRAEAIANNPGPLLSTLSEALREGDRQQLKDAIHAAYNGPNGTVGNDGARVEFTRVSNGTDRIKLIGRIKSKDGQDIGSIERTIHYENGEPSWVYNDYLSIEREFQGQGIANDIYANQENWFIRDGVERIEITANIDVGGYAWARAGFDYKDLSVATSHINSMTRRASEFYGEDSDVYKQLDAIRFQLSEAYYSDEVDDEDTSFPTPFEMSRIGYEDRYQDPDTGRMMWAGKELMLGTHWNAVKYLVPPTESSRNE